MEGSFRIGEWLVESVRNRLARGELQVKIDPKIMQVLVYLAEHADDVARKEKIIEVVWEDTSHMLFGHRRPVSSVAVSPDGQWIASSDIDGEIRLWPMPEGPPLHTLPYEELLDRLRSLANLRVVPDEGTSSGYRFDYAPFPGWERVPVW